MRSQGVTVPRRLLAQREGRTARFGSESPVATVSRPLKPPTARNQRSRGAGDPSCPRSPIHIPPVPCCVRIGNYLRAALAVPFPDLTRQPGQKFGHVRTPLLEFAWGWPRSLRAICMRRGQSGRWVGWFWRWRPTSSCYAPPARRAFAAVTLIYYCKLGPGHELGIVVGQSRSGRFQCGPFPAGACGWSGGVTPNFWKLLDSSIITPRTPLRFPPGGRG